MVVAFGGFFVEVAVSVHQVGESGVSGAVHSLAERGDNVVDNPTTESGIFYAAIFVLRLLFEVEQPLLFGPLVSPDFFETSGRAAEFLALDVVGECCGGVVAKMLLPLESENDCGDTLRKRTI